MHSHDKPFILTSQAVQAQLGSPTKRRKRHRLFDRARPVKFGAVRPGDILLQEKKDKINAYQAGEKGRTIRYEDSAEPSEEYVNVTKIGAKEDIQRIVYAREVKPKPESWLLLSSEFAEGAIRRLNLRRLLPKPAPEPPSISNQTFERAPRVQFNDVRRSDILAWKYRGKIKVARAGTKHWSRRYEDSAEPSEEYINIQALGEKESSLLLRSEFKIMAIRRLDRKSLPKSIQQWLGGKMLAIAMLPYADLGFPQHPLAFGFHLPSWILPMALVPLIIYMNRRLLATINLPNQTHRLLSAA